MTICSLQQTPSISRAAAGLTKWREFPLPNFLREQEERIIAMFKRVDFWCVVIGLFIAVFAIVIEKLAPIFTNNDATWVAVAAIWMSSVIVGWVNIGQWWLWSKDKITIEEHNFNTGRDIFPFILAMMSGYFLFRLNLVVSIMPLLLTGLGFFVAGHWAMYITRKVRYNFENEDACWITASIPVGVALIIGLVGFCIAFFNQDVSQKIVKWTGAGCALAAIYFLFTALVNVLAETGANAAEKRISRDASTEDLESMILFLPQRCGVAPPPIPRRFLLRRRMTRERVKHKEG